jgi:large subunit ribosomal protein L14e
MFEIGRVCVKLAGRDSNKKCIVIDVIDDKTVLIDGETRRRKCNIKHLEPLEQTVKVSKNASATEVAKVFKEMGIEIKETKQKEKTVRPKKIRKTKEKAEPEKKDKKKAKEDKKKEDKKAKDAAKEAKKEKPKKEKAEKK